MPAIYNNNLTPSLWGSQGNVKPTSTTSATSNVGGSNGEIQYNDNGALNGIDQSNYDSATGMFTIGPVANVNITGGVPGQVLTKDATGNMMWANSGVPNQPQIHFDVPVTGVSQSFAHPNLATFQDSTYAGVFRNGVLMPTDAYLINGSVLSFNTMLLAGDRVDVLETSAGTVATGNIGNVNLNGNANTFLDGTGNWQVVSTSNVVYGTVAPLNLDGNINNWLRGDGVWANIDMPDGNIANINLNGNTVQYLRGDGNWTNIAVPTGNIANTNYNGNAETYLNGQGSWVTVVSGGIPGGSNSQLQFNNNGVLGGVPNTSFDGANLVLGSNTNIKLTGGNANSVLLTDGTGNLSWRDVVNYAAVPRMEFNVISAGTGQTFTNANLAVYPNSSYATVFRNGVLMDPTDYVISGTNITFPIRLEIGESIDVAASASVGTGSSGNGTGTVSNVATDGSGLGFTLSGGPITTTGTITLGVPSATSLRTTLTIGNVANANFTGNGNLVLAGNGVWRSVSAVAGNTTEIQYNLNGVLTATNNMRYDTANNVVTFEGKTNLLDTVIVEGDIIPFQSNTYNLGNSTHRWKDVFLSSNSVVVGDTTLSSNGGLNIDGEIAVTAPNNTITIGNIVANTLSGEGSNITGLTLSSIAGIGNIATVDLNGNSSQVLTGDGTWVAQLGNGTVANANYADFAGTADVANAVTLANVSGAGNIASINLDGNASNVLAGDGTFVTKNSVAGNSGEIQFNSNGVFGGSSNLVFDDANSTFTAWADKIQMGLNTVANVSGGVAIGSYSASTAEGGIAVGYGSTVGANADYAVAIGIATVFANAMDAIAIGRAGITSANSIAIGSGATAGEYNNPSSSSAIAIGTGAYSESANSIAFGAGSYISVGAPDSIAMGTSAHALASSGIAIGNNANVLSLNGVAIGANAFCDVENTIVLGSDIVSNTKVQGSLTVTDITTLGDVANVKITGGQYGQFLKTDGEGNLIFDDATANLGNIATINLSGNSLQYLAGNGAWAGFNVGNIITANYNGNGSQYLSGNGVWSAPVAKPAGLTNEIQFNDGNVFGSSANLIFNKAFGILATRSIEATVGITASLINAPSRDLTIASGGSGIGSGNINIATGGNPATGGGNIFIQSGANGTSNIYIGSPSQSSNNRSRTTITGDVVLKTPVPASASANGIAGQTAVDSGFIYVCVATNTWQRAALSTW